LRQLCDIDYASVRACSHRSRFKTSSLVATGDGWSPVRFVGHVTFSRSCRTGEDPALELTRLTGMCVNQLSAVEFVKHRFLRPLTGYIVDIVVIDSNDSCRIYCVALLVPRLFTCKMCRMRLKLFWRTQNHDSSACISTSLSTL